MSKDIELTDVALLMKQRDKIFTRLMQIHNKSGVRKEESGLLKNVIKYNAELYEKITQRKDNIKKGL